MILRTFAVTLALGLSALAMPAAVRPEVARLLPPDAVMVGGFDLQALRGTPFFDAVKERLRLDNDERLDHLFALTGFDPKQDLHRILGSGVGVPGRDSRGTLMIAEGRFDIFAPGSAALSVFEIAGQQAGFTLYKAPRDKPTPLEPAFSFLDAQTFVFGPEAQVRAAIDRWVQPAAEPSKPALAALAQQDAHAWAATLEPAELLSAMVEHLPGGGGPLQAIAASMQTAALRATASADSVLAEMAFLCGGPDDARSLADAAQTMAAFGALTAQRDRPELADLLSKLQVNQRESETTLSIQLTGAQLSSLRR